MDIKNYLNVNLYEILQVNRNADKTEIKKSYKSLSKKYHPDINENVDPSIIVNLTLAYRILTSDNRLEWDTKSIYGNNYDETSELLNYEFNNNAKIWDNDKLNNWISQNQLNILHYVDINSFKGHIIYERLVICKKCNGDGKDIDSEIEIKDDKGNVIRTIEGSDTCDFCMGVGKYHTGQICQYCTGKGKIGWEDCKVCKGNRLILGKQKLNGIKIPETEKALKMSTMGHFSKYEYGKVGDLWIIKK